MTNWYKKSGKGMDVDQLITSISETIANHFAEFSNSVKSIVGTSEKDIESQMSKKRFLAIEKCCHEIENEFKNFGFTLYKSEVVWSITYEFKIFCYRVFTELEGQDFDNMYAEIKKMLYKHMKDYFLTIEKDKDDEIELDKEYGKYDPSEIEKHFGAESVSKKWHKEAAPKSKDLAITSNTWLKDAFEQISATIESHLYYYNINSPIRNPKTQLDIDNINDFATKKLDRNLRIQQIRLCASDIYAFLVSVQLGLYSNQPHHDNATLIDEFNSKIYFGDIVFGVFENMEKWGIHDKTMLSKIISSLNEVMLLKHVMIGPINEKIEKENVEEKYDSEVMKEHFGSRDNWYKQSEDYFDKGKSYNSEDLIDLEKEFPNPFTDSEEELEATKAEKELKEMGESNLDSNEWAGPDEVSELASNIQKNVFRSLYLTYGFKHGTYAFIEEGNPERKYGPLIIIMANKEKGLFAKIYPSGRIEGEIETKNPYKLSDDELSEKLVELHLSTMKEYNKPAKNSKEEIEKHFGLESKNDINWYKTAKLYSREEILPIINSDQAKKVYVDINGQKIEVKNLRIIPEAYDNYISQHHEQQTYYPVNIFKGKNGFGIAINTSKGWETQRWYPSFWEAEEIVKKEYPNG